MSKKYLKKTDGEWQMEVVTINLPNLKLEYQLLCKMFSFTFVG